VLHLQLTSDLALDQWKASSDADRQPHHLMGEMRDAFGAVTHPPRPDQVRLIDRLLATLCDEPAQWASARLLSKQVDDRDVVFSVSEDMTLPMLFWLQARRKRTAMISTVMNPGRLRMKVLFRAFRAGHRLGRCFALTPLTADIMRDELGLPAAKVQRFPMETDIAFFRPVTRSRFRDRPLVFAAGLEQRDYTTLADATADLDLDVEVCAKSPDATSRTRMSMPTELPGNMRFHPYEWTDYRRMFSEADVIVVPVLPNRYGAGLTTMVEGMACGRPVIVTDDSGLPAELAAQGAIMTVPAQDPVALQAAIEKILANPDLAESLGATARNVAERVFSTANAVETLASVIDDIAPGAAKLQRHAAKAA